MRELIEKDKEITIVPADFKFANKGKIIDVEQRYFTVELKYEPDGIMRHNYCEFYTQTKHGTLYFDSFPETIDGKIIKIANPAKHKFLQRRQYRRIKYVHELDLFLEDKNYKITTLDISAGGMKFRTSEIINIDKIYSIQIPLSEKQTINCLFSPIRIEKNEDSSYTISGRYSYSSNADKMTLTQYCAKRSIEIKNK